MSESLVLGTRGSALALAQSQQVADAITAATGLSVRLQIIRTRGDAIQDRPLAKVGGKGLFTAELEEGLRAGEIDLAVHSAKDLPTEDPPDLAIGAWPARQDPRDVLVGPSLEDLRLGAVVGTGSQRRRLQLLDLRPDLVITDIRGNVDTRLAKRDAGQYDAILLAAAGLARLGITRPDARPLSIAQMVPAAGQGILAIQTRSADDRVLAAVRAIDVPEARAAAGIERAFLRAWGGGCDVPAAAHAWPAGEAFEVTGFVAGADGNPRRATLRGPAAGLGEALAEALGAG